MRATGISVDRIAIASNFLAIASATSVEGNDMAQYKYAEYLNQGNSEAYDTTYKPGEDCLNSGIYRCESCGDEIASNKGNPFPPQNHHQHAVGQGAIRWKLVVFAQQK